jgi:D-3-phosphoglycerate dehydrogenase
LIQSVDCTLELDTVLRSRKLEVPSSLTIHHGVSSDAELMKLCSCAELLLVEHTVIPASILSRCSKLRASVFMGTGASFYIPLEEARALGIEVRTIPGYGNRAVAEHALALALAGARQVARMDRELRRGVWVPRGGIQLYERKVAVVGLGDIGSTFADMAAALGMRVAGWNRTRKNLPYFVDDLETALRGADVV